MTVLLNTRHCYLLTLRSDKGSWLLLRWYYDRCN